MRRRKSAAAARATGSVRASVPSVEQARCDLVELAGRDADHTDAEALEPLRNTRGRAGFPDDRDGRRECDDAFVVEAEGIADLRQRARRLRIIAVRADADDLVGRARGEQEFREIRRDAHDPLARRRRCSSGGGETAADEHREREQERARLQASTSRRNAAPRSRRSRSSRRQSNAGPGSVLRPGAMSL